MYDSKLLFNSNPNVINFFHYLSYIKFLLNKINKAVITGNY